MKEIDDIKRRTVVNNIVSKTFLSITLLCASVIVFIVLFILIKGLSPFVKSYVIEGESYRVNLLSFIFSTKWQVGISGYGVGYIIINTIYITVFSTLIAVPISVLTALFITKIAPKKLGIILNSVIELLASIPSIIYGLFGVGVITKLVKNISNLFNYQSAGGTSTLATILVLSIMIIPTITMLSVTAIKSVNKTIVHGSLALGATKTQTNFKVVLTAAKGGIFSGIILGVGRALGEATAVSLVAGNALSGPNFNPFDITRTLTSTILMGMKETTGLDYDVRFSVGIVLIILIIVVNIILNAVKKRLGKMS